MSRGLKLEKMTFEEAMERLEATVHSMESGDLPLDQIIERYEEGMKLVEFCGERLKAASKKVELLTQTASGTLKSSVLEESETDSNKSGTSLF
jgi:exodeoxyribonuclease VII small subunit